MYIFKNISVSDLIWIVIEWDEIGWVLFVKCFYRLECYIEIDECGYR